jgi:hypothetical protein
MYDPNKCIWTLEVQQDGEDYFIQFTDEMLAQVGWQVGDVLVWEKVSDTSWVLRKKS